MGITQETRRTAYYETQERSPARRKEIYQALEGHGPMTGEELMVLLGHSDPNCVRPRLTELKKAGLIQAVGKRRSQRTGKQTAVWEVAT